MDAGQLIYASWEIETLICLQRIYNFWLLHAIILSILDVNGLIFTLIIFGTNLLTGGPTHIAVFAYFSVSQKRNIKRSPNGMKPSGALFLEQIWSGELGVQVKKAPRTPRDSPPLRARPLSCGPLERPSTYLFLLYIPTDPEHIQENHETQFPLP